uniref:Uncharacterized protein n=1 Tax=Arundo donax TaxID=35708 RepID=A0A0A9CBW6_ARUDO
MYPGPTKRLNSQILKPVS